MMFNKKFLFTLLIFIFLISAPYLFGYFSTPAGYAFTGFFINSYDGHSYLAKIQQGFEGSWLFSLDYSPETSSGAFIMVPYLVLGHIIRWLGGHHLVWLHGTRIITSTILAIALYDFMASLFPEDERKRWWAFWLSLFGSGLGWLALLAGAFPMDFWVAEAYSFLSSYTNLHFPLGLALQVWLLKPDETKPSVRHGTLLVAGGLLLGLISAFSVPVVLTVWGGVFLLRWWAKENPWPIFWRGFWIGVGGLPVILYDYFAILADPVLSQWNAQNVTSTPPFWDFLLSFSPALLLAIPGLYFAWRRKQPADRVLMSWIVLCFLLAFSPFPLQRRFLIGFSIPLAALAVKTLQHVVKPPRQHLAWLVIVLLALPTNLILLMGAVFGVNTVSPQIYIAPSELAAFAWLDEHAPAEAIVIASPQTGTLLPAHTDMRVVYGHPFESLQAETREQWVLDFYAGEINPIEANAFFTQLNATYIFMGPRESELGQVGWLNQLEPIYQAGDVKIYAINP